MVIPAPNPYEAPRAEGEYRTQEPPPPDRKKLLNCWARQRALGISQFLTALICLLLLTRFLSAYFSQELPIPALAAAYTAAVLLGLATYTAATGCLMLTRYLAGLWMRIALFGFGSLVRYGYAIALLATGPWDKVVRGNLMIGTAYLAFAIFFSRRMERLACDPAQTPRVRQATAGEWRNTLGYLFGATWFTISDLSVAVILTKTVFDISSLSPWMFWVERMT